MRSFRFLLAGVGLALSLGTAAASEGPEIPHQHWSHDGFFGTFDRAALQRGYQVYKEVCSACHSMKQMRFRNLEGIGLDEAQIKAVAAEFETTDGPNDDGEMFQRPSRPSDRFRMPFANDNAARAVNGGALPPDLSLIAKNRKGGENYVVALLTGYADPPEGVTVPEGMHYNKVFPGHMIAMNQPIQDDAVTYADGTKATVDQMAHDVATFLAYAASPHLEARNALGVKVMLFLFVLAGLLYAAKRKIWKGLH
ncbi:MAG: cytochrome c1 [Alphaproteobacteria bacterium]|nr:cytochrome c1 [Alphaproteobacteria bacterium]